MVYRGIVKNGVVVVEGGVKLPEGIEVRIEPLVEQLRNVIRTVPERLGRAKK
ncbi:MAG: hypothetical protein ACYC35_23585 [Pirellulales bacterium]